MPSREADDEVAHHGTSEAGPDPVEFATLVQDRAGRRRLRELLQDLSLQAAAELAGRLLAFRDDFDMMRRDSTTPLVVTALRREDLLGAAALLAGSNTAAAFWERLLAESPDAIIVAIERVFRYGDVVAREFAIDTLLLDSLHSAPLPPPVVNRLLELALAGMDDEVRGLAAEFAASAAPTMVAEPHWVLDPSERARAAAWQVAFERDPSQAVDRAVDLIDDDAQSSPARRSALVAIGERLSTADISPLLAMLVDDQDPELALDAASLLWRYHRTPDVAQIATESRHEAVREIALRLLDPTRGSPEAGGFRPGASEQGYGFYDQFRRQINRSTDADPSTEPDSNPSG